MIQKLLKSFSAAAVRGHSRINHRLRRGHPTANGAPTAKHASMASPVMLTGRAHSSETVGCVTFCAKSSGNASAHASWRAGSAHRA